jgi:hypothetical protein
VVDGKSLFVTLTTKAEFAFLPLRLLSLMPLIASAFGSLEAPITYPPGQLQKE